MKNSNNSNDYLNLIAKYEYISCINNFTRVTESSNTFIDHIFIKNIELNKITSNLLRCDTTDHYAITLILSDVMFKIYIININKVNIGLLNKLMSSKN